MADITSGVTHGNLELEMVLRDLSTSKVVSKDVTFAGGTTNDVGDQTGTGNPATLFSVVGDVLVYVVGVCKTSLTGDTATLEVGVTGATAALIAQSTATDIDVNEGWYAAAPTLAVANTPQSHVIGGGLDIIQTVGTADITAGRIVYYCFWKALSSDGLVVAA